MNKRLPGHLLPVLVADGDPNVRAAVRLLLAHHPDLRVVAENDNLEELLRDTVAMQPRVILLDLELRGLRIGDHLGILRTLCPAAAVIALGMREEQRQRLLAAGATAFVSKSDAPDKLLRALGEAIAP